MAREKRDEFLYRFRHNHKGHLLVDKRIKRNKRLAKLFDWVEKLSSGKINAKIELAIPKDTRRKKSVRELLQNVFGEIFEGKMEVIITTQDWVPLLYISSVSCDSLWTINDMEKCVKPNSCERSRMFKLILSKRASIVPDVLIHLSPELAVVAVARFTERGLCPEKTCSYRYLGFIEHFRFDFTTVSRSRR